PRRLRREAGQVQEEVEGEGDEQAAAQSRRTLRSRCVQVNAGVLDAAAARRARGRLPPVEPRDEPRGDILIVDDNPAHLDLLGQMRRGQGYRVGAVVDGERALSAASASTASASRSSGAWPR